MEIEREEEKMVIPSVGVLVIKNNKVLLVKHGHASSHVTGVYGFPAGRFLPGESEKQTAVREFFEETGLHILEKDLINFPGNLYSAEITRKEGLVLFSIKVFLCHKFSGILVSTEETEPEWIEMSQLNSLHLLPNVARAIHDAQRFLSTVV